MKVEINHKGYLVITSETSLESWALEKWVKENIPQPHEVCDKFGYVSKMIFDWSFGHEIANKNAQ